VSAASIEEAPPVFSTVLNISIDSLSEFGYNDARLGVRADSGLARGFSIY
jgi:hypothetical protein